MTEAKAKAAKQGLKQIQIAGQSDNPVVFAIVIMSLITVVAVVAVAVMVPAPESTPIIGQILTAMVPTMAALAAYLKASQSTDAVREVHLQINSRMDQLLAVSSLAARAEGRAEGVAAGGPEGELTVGEAMKRGGEMIEAAEDRQGERDADSAGP